MGLREGKVALVTGASRGIGRSIALTFAREGATVLFTGTSASAAFERTMEELQSLSAGSRGFVSDAGDFAASEALVDGIVRDYQRIDVLVNNAGITRDTLLMRMQEAQWDEVLRVNLKSAFNMTHAVVRPMLKQRAGSIINMSSVVGVSGNAGQSNYAASKAGLIGFTKSLAQELGSRSIRVNAIAPGFILTDMTSELSAEVQAEWAERIPLRRGGSPEDVAKVALFLASDLAGYVTGQVINVCGGMNT